MGFKLVLKAVTIHKCKITRYGLSSRYDLLLSVGSRLVNEGVKPVIIGPVIYTGISH